MGPMSAWTGATLRRMTLTQRMLERLDVDTTKVVCADFGMTFRSVVGRFRACGDEEVCSRWLDGEETGERSVALLSQFQDLRVLPPTVVFRACRAPLRASPGRRSGARAPHSSRSSWRS